jgi:hypothetical protein
VAAPAFTRAGGAIGDAVSLVTSQLEGLGTFWGNDAAGQQFGAVYAPYQAQLLQLLAIVSGEVAGITDGINKMADEYHIAEQANVNKIRSLSNEMP